MTNNNINPNEFFSHPWRGILVLSIFLIVSPPMQMLVLVLFDHQWIGGRELLIEISNVIKSSFLPRIMGSYSYFMAQAVFVSFYCGYGVAKGKALTLNNAITAFVVVGLVMEVIIQCIILLINHLAFNWMLVLITIVQAIVAGFVCWLIARKFKLNYPADAPKN